MRTRLKEQRACLRCGKMRMTRADRRNYCVECRDDVPRPVATWMEHGACRNEAYDPEWWWPERGDAEHGTNPLALRICGACPVRDLCLDYAMKHDEREGIWGGLMAPARRALAAHLRHRQAV